MGWGMIRNVILDWSGTVADDLAAVLVATNGVLVHLGREALTRQGFRELFRLPYTEFYAEVLPEVSLEVVKALYLEHFPSGTVAVPLLPHAREFLQYALATGRRLAVLSSAPEEHVREQARANGVEDWFEALWCGVTDKRLAAPVLLAALGMKPHETLFVGDMRHDIEAAKAGGVMAVAVATGYERAEVLLEAEPDVLLANLSHLPRLMGPERPVATVGALIFNHAGEVLLVRTHKWKNRWGIAGGKIRRGETSIQALRRETLEETGLTLERVDLVMVQDAVDPEEFESRAHFVLLNYVARCREENPDVRLNDEAEVFVWVTLAEGLKMDLNQPTRVLMEKVAADRQGGRVSVLGEA